MPVTIPQGRTIASSIVLKISMRRSMKWACCMFQPLYTRGGIPGMSRSTHHPITPKFPIKAKLSVDTLLLWLAIMIGVFGCKTRGVNPGETKVLRYGPMKIGVKIFQTPG